MGQFTVSLGVARATSLRRTYSLRPALWLLLTTHHATATLWDNPNFTAMLTESKLIVSAEVVEGGAMFGRARALEVFKGEAPTGDFVVTGFNNGCWPKQEWVHQSLKPKEQYLYFLQPTKAEEPIGTGFIAWSACGGELVVPKPWRTLPRYAVPTPSIGDYRIDARGVHSDWRFCSDCSESLAVPAYVVWTQLRALARPEDLDAVRVARSDLGHLLTPELVAKAPSDESARVILAWLLEGQAAFGQANARAALLAAVDVAQPDIRVAAVRALPSLGVTEEVLQLLDRLLRTQGAEEAGALQLYATRALGILEPKGHRAVGMLLGALATSDANEVVHRDVAVPTLGPWESAREAMIRALSRYRAPNAEPIFVGLLRRNDNAPGTLDALMQHFLNYPAPRARSELLRLYASTPNGQLDGLHRYFIDDGNPGGLEAIFARMLGATADLDERRRMLEYYALHRPEGDARLEAAFVTLLGAREPDPGIARLIPLALTLRNEQLIHRLLHVDSAELPDGDPKTLERVARALQLKRSASLQAEQRLGSWIQLLMDDRWSRQATPFLLRACSCSTPPELRPKLLQAFEQEELGQLKEQFVLALGFDPLRRDQRRTPEFICGTSQTVAVAVNAAQVPVAPGLVPAARRGGCSAGCAVASHVDTSPAFLVVVLLGPLGRILSKRKRRRN